MSKYFVRHNGRDKFRVGPDPTGEPIERIRVLLAGDLAAGRVKPQHQYELWERGITTERLVEAFSGKRLLLAQVVRA